MTEEFADVIDGKVVKIVKRGEKYKHVILPTDGDDSPYTDLGLLPLVGIKPSYTKYQILNIGFDIQPDVVNYVYSVVDIPLVEAKELALLELLTDVDNFKDFIATVVFEDATTTEIGATREDQADIRERYELMKEDSISNLYFKDIYGTLMYLFHLDVKRCHKAITIYRNDLIEYQWSKEVEINACTTTTEIEAVVWDFSSI